MIDHNVYKGQSPRSGEVGHLIIIPDGELCCCGQRGCLKAFFEQLRKGNAKCAKVWETYLDHLSAAVNSVRMLFDCDIIPGGYVGGYVAGLEIERAAITCADW